MAFKLIGQALHSPLNTKRPYINIFYLVSNKLHPCGIRLVFWKTTKELDCSLGFSLLLVVEGRKLGYFPRG